MDDDKFLNLVKAAQGKVERAEVELEKAQRELEAVELAWSLYQEMFGQHAQPPDGEKREHHAALASPPKPVETLEQEPEAAQGPDAEPGTATTAQDRMWEDAPTPNGVPKAFVLKEEVRKAAKEFRGETFAQKDVTRRIREKYPDRTVYPGSVSATLATLANDKEIRVIKKARGGSDPTLYREVPVSP